MKQDCCGTQTDIDRVTDSLTKILVEATLLSDISTNSNLVKPTLSKCSKGKVKKRKSHPKWHDMNCADAHRSVLLTSKLLKMDPKNLF